jgi:hypothetical protein
MRFSIPLPKLYEFTLTMERLVKWPVYILHSPSQGKDAKKFELIRSWTNESAMEKDLASSEYRNLTGVIEILGSAIESNIYSVIKRKALA